MITAVMDQWCPQVLQWVAAQLPQLLPPVEVFPIFPENADICRCTFFEPHSGQSTESFSSRLRKRTSKRAWHFRHLNSKIGMDSSPTDGIGSDLNPRALCPPIIAGGD